MTVSTMPLCSQVAKAKKITKRKQTLKFTIDCSQPVDDGIMDAASFVRFSRRSAHRTLGDGSGGPE
jgi:large subunit ribosomal protein L22e